MFAQLKSRFLSFLLKIVFNFLFWSCTLKVVDEDSLLNTNKTGAPLLVCCWHSQAVLLARYFKLTSFDVWGVSSTHADSEVLARVLRSWNIKLIRGSSTRGWVNVIKKMFRLFKVPKSIVVVTPDGPRGPKKRAKSGAFKIAKKQNVQIVACALLSTRFWKLPSWDKTIIPRPFSKIYLKFSSPFPLDSKINTSSISLFIDQNQKTLDDHVF